MLKYIFAPLIIMFFFLNAISQDTITRKSGEDIQVKILEVNQTDIRYKKYENIEGPTYSMLRNEIVMIRYANGTRDIFVAENKDDGESLEKYSKEDLFRKGQTDALINYRKYKGAGGGTLAVSLISPLAGLIPAIACSATSPKEINLGYPSVRLMNMPEYREGYTKKAKRIKVGKVWKNWGIAFGANLAAALILVAASGY
jgi:hypothetical protein